MTSDTSEASRFSAAGPALGYLAQVDYALWAMLERMDVEESFSLSIETLDDIVFHDDVTGDATQKWQSKHSIGASVGQPPQKHTELLLLLLASSQLGWNDARPGAYGFPTGSTDLL